MKRAIVVSIPVLAAFLFLGCDHKSQAPAAYAAKAYAAVSTGVSLAPKANEVGYSGSGSSYNSVPATVSSPGGGSLTVKYSSDVDPMAVAGTVEGTLVFKDWVDTFSGYTINGEITESISIDGPVNALPLSLTITLTGTPELGGAPVATLECDITKVVEYPGNNPLVFTTASSGTVTADGKQFDISSF
jgi:hypothetical protein